MAALEYRVAMGSGLELHLGMKLNYMDQAKNLVYSARSALKRRH